MEWHDKVKKGNLKREKVLLPYATTSILSVYVWLKYTHVLTTILDIHEKVRNLFWMII